jgi:glycogen debranching enzyme
MAQKSKTMKTEPFSHAETTVTEMAGTARKNYEQAFKTGQKLQGEVAQWWSRMAGQTATAADWQKQFANFTNMVSRVIPLAQKRIEEAMDLVEKNGRTNAELMRKAVDAAQTHGLAECQNKWMDVWASSMKAMQNNVEAYNELGCKALDSWVAFARETDDTATRAAA